MADFSLRYLIDVAADKAVSALRSLDREFQKLNRDANATTSAGSATTNISGMSSALSSLGSVAGPAAKAIGVAATAITAVTGAASLAATTILSFARDAAAFGSEISDIRDKTGLAAETLIAMRFAAEQSGTSLETVTKGVTKFAKLVGEAARGSKEAEALLRRFGITSAEAMNDLDGALDKVFKGLLNARSGVEQMALAQQLFGKSGADLLPFIKTFNGDLRGLTDEARKLGLTFDNETAAAADRLDDKLAVIKLQFEGLKTQIGLAFIPVLTDLATTFSDFLRANQADIKRWAEVAATFTTGVVETFSRLSRDVQAFINGPGGKLLGYLQDVYERFTAVGAVSKFIRELELGVLNKIFSMGESRQNASPLAAEAGGTIDLTGELTEIEKITQQKTRAIEQQIAQISDVVRAGKERIARLLAEGTIDRKTALTAELDLERNALATRERLLRQQLAIVLGNADEEAAITGRLQQLKLEQMAFEDSARRRLAESEKTLTAESVKRQSEAIEFAIRERQAMLDTAIARNRASLALGIMDEKSELEARLQLEEDFLIFKRDQLDKQLELVRGNAEEETRINRQIAIANLELERKQEENILRTNEFAREKTRAADEAALRVRMDSIRAGEREQIALINRRLELNKLLLAAGVIDARTEFELRQRLEARILEERRKSLEKQLEAVRGNADEERRIQSELAELKIEIDTAEIRRTREKIELNKQYEESLKRISKAAQRVMDFTGLRLFRSDAEIMAETMKNLADMSQQAFQSMIDGVGELIQAWVLYGDVGPDAVRKMLASVLAALAQEAAVKALFQLAEGFAALFLNPAEAAAHFKAAAIYGAVAATAAVAGRAIAGDAFKQGSATGAGGRGSGGGRSVAGTGTGATPTPIQRESQNAYVSGRDEQVMTLAKSIDRLAAKIDSQTPGNILVAGVRQRPGVVAETVEREVRSNSAFGTRLLRQAGAR